VTVEQATVSAIAFAGVIVAVGFLARLLFERRRLRSMERQWKAASRKIGHRVIVLNDCTCCPVHGPDGMRPAENARPEPASNKRGDPMITTDPIAIYDSRSGGGPWPDIADWCTQQDLNPKAIYRLEIYFDHARVFEYVTDEGGRKRLQPDGPAKRAPYDVPLTSLPPGVTA
jgi:hypothetical protein